MSARHYADSLPQERGAAALALRVPMSDELKDWLDSRGALATEPVSAKAILLRERHWSLDE